MRKVLLSAVVCVGVIIVYLLSKNETTFNETELICLKSLSYAHYQKAEEYVLDIVMYTDDAQISSNVLGVELDSDLVSITCYEFKDGQSMNQYFQRTLSLKLSADKVGKNQINSLILNMSSGPIEIDIGELNIEVSEDIEDTLIYVTGAYPAIIPSFDKVTISIVNKSDVDVTLESIRVADTDRDIEEHISKDEVVQIDVDISSLGQGYDFGFVTPMISYTANGEHREYLLPQILVGYLSVTEEKILKAID